MNYILFLAQTTYKHSYIGSDFMLLTVPCAKNQCIYQKDGLCMLDTAKAPAQLQSIDNECMYYCTEEYLTQLINSKNPAQKRKTTRLQFSSNLHPHRNTRGEED